MRGARLFILAFTFVSACSAPPRPPSSPPADSFVDASKPNPSFRLDFPETTPVTDHLPGGGLKGDAPAAPAPAKPAGVVQTSAELPVRKEPTSEDVLKLQKEVAARPAASDDEKLRLVLLHAAAGNLEEAERVLS